MLNVYERARGSAKPVYRGYLKGFHAPKPGISWVELASSIAHHVGVQRLPIRDVTVLIDEADIMRFGFPKALEARLGAHGAPFKFEQEVDVMTDKVRVSWRVAEVDTSVFEEIFDLDQFVADEPNDGTATAEEHWWMKHRGHTITSVSHDELPEHWVTGIKAEEARIRMETEKSRIALEALTKEHVEKAFKSTMDEMLKTVLYNGAPPMGVAGVVSPATSVTSAVTGESTLTDLLRDRSGILKPTYHPIINKKSLTP